jgi:RNA polymerase sigma-70 factor (ECF subfamily)
MSAATPLCPEQELIERLRRRDETAMAVFYDRYAHNLYHVIHKLVRQPTAAEDVLQDSMVKIWFSFSQYDPARGRLYTWALNLCKRTAIDHLRAQHSRGTGRTAPLDTCWPAQQLSTPGFWPEHIGVADWSAHLRPEYKRVIDLLYFGGCTQTEAAEELGLPLGTLKTHARQALQCLAASLQEA